jgi:hypothetical protein
MKKYLIIALTLTSCLSLLGQSNLPANLTANFSGETINEVSSATNGMQLTDNQYFNIAKAIKNHQDKFRFSNVGLLKYKEELELSVKQKEKWLKYFANYLLQSENNADRLGPAFTMHHNFYKEILTENQYNKFINLLSAPGGSKMAEEKIEVLTRLEIPTDESDLELLKSYYSNRRMAIQRYVNKPQKKNEALRMLKKQRGKRLAFLLTSLKKDGNPGNGQYRGTYKW